MDREYEVNTKESTLPNLMIDPKFYMYHQKGELDERHSVTNFSILNRTDDCNWNNINCLFYIPIDFTGNEEEIYEYIQKNRVNKKIDIPYYWQPMYTEHQEFWNIVTFIVCRKGITTYNQARKFVDNFLYEEYSFESNNVLKSNYYKEAIATNKIPSAHITIENIEKKIQEFFKEYEIGNVISIGLRTLVQNVLWSEYLWRKIRDLTDPEGVRMWLLSKHLPAEIIPESIKFFADIDDYILNLNYLKTLYTKEDILKAFNLLEKVKLG
ncbi:hypothetical protein PTI45_03097 [Paenibacillus nuruki]|uniref:Uncharacterized protein n=1 Tax=Paenibacillus nuruki TaxID=1886670 RepID=A0A1E3L2Z0_9BACL|nr:hypothetical protein [Paenibacillus nuruki]ODP27535.1 hypothetical protein PTI45_03097 [Paenibacillus nuruki]